MSKHKPEPKKKAEPRHKAEPKKKAEPKHKAEVSAPKTKTIFTGKFPITVPVK